MTVHDPYAAPERRSPPPELPTGRLARLDVSNVGNAALEVAWSRADTDGRRALAARIAVLTDSALVQTMNLPDGTVEETEAWLQEVPDPKLAATLQLVLERRREGHKARPAFTRRLEGMVE